MRGRSIIKRPTVEPCFSDGCGEGGVFRKEPVAWVSESPCKAGFFDEQRNGLHQIDTLLSCYLYDGVALKVRFAGERDQQPRARCTRS